MKKRFCITVAGFFIMLCFRAADHLPVITPTHEAKAVFEKMTVDYNATEIGLNGMLLHSKFTV